MKHAVVILTLIAIIAGCTGASDADYRGKLASVSVRADDCRLRVGHKDGNTFFAAPIGSEYTITVRNLTGRRILAIPTVDGLNVIDRSRGDWDGSGYVLGPYESVEIPGFRRGDDFQYVERFTFNKARFSLASRIGDVRNVGVIGVAVFEEYVPPPPPPRPVYDYKSSSNDRLASAPAAEGMMEEAECSRAKGFSQHERAGTEAGRTVHDPVRRVTFRRASDTPNEILALYYDTEENLVSAGIFPPPYEPPPIGFLSPFPSNYRHGSYVAD